MAFSVSNSSASSASQASPTSINISEGISSWVLGTVAGVIVLGLVIWLIKRKH